MIIIPAVDIREGRCVRLYQGKLEDETVFSEDPVSVALSWESLGAKMLHLIDLDGAFAGEPRNMDVIREIVNRLNIPVELGGGIRSLEIIEKLLSLGVDRVILGTVAITEPELVKEACKRYGERIVVGIDSKNGKAAVEGWETTAAKEDMELVLEMRKCGARRIIYTDTSRDGTLQGLNLNRTLEVAKKSGLPVIAAGGVGNLNEIKELKKLEPHGVEGVILGRSLYTGEVSFKEALRVAESGEVDVG